MQFTIADHGPPSVLEGLMFLLFLGALVGPPLVWWLRKGPRDVHDVLGSDPLPRRRRLQGFRDLLTWACMAVVFMGPLLAVLAAFFFNDAAQSEMNCIVGDARVNELLELSRTDNTLDAHPMWWPLAAMTVVGCLLRVRWLRSAPSERDVLHLASRTA